MNTPIASLCLTGLALCIIHSAIASPSPWRGSEPAEQKFIEVVRAIEQGAGNEAYTLAGALVETYPTFQLAQLVYADLLAAQGMNPVVFNDRYKREFDGLRQEARARLSHEYRTGGSLIPSNLLMMSTEYRHVLVFELERSRAYLFENRFDTPRLIEDYYISIGKAGIDKQIEGDNKTPLGIYRITAYLPDSEIPERYGIGAYPIDYPNDWDRLQGKTGHGIWLHGVARSAYSRPPLDSDGCMVVSNINLERISDKIDLDKTPVVLTQKIRWITLGENERLRNTLQVQFEQWRRDWMSLDVDAYLQHYSANFSTYQHNFNSWQAYKRRIAAGKSFIRVETDRQDMFLYPDPAIDDPLIVINFQQIYSSSNFNALSNKQQFWRLEADGKWRIVYEGT